MGLVIESGWMVSDDLAGLVVEDGWMISDDLVGLVVRGVGIGASTSIGDWLLPDVGYSRKTSARKT